jgi:hypothetical protein
LVWSDPVNSRTSSQSKPKTILIEKEGFNSATDLEMLGGAVLISTKPVISASEEQLFPQENIFI